ncbi:serine/threonine protein kinase, CMGC, CDC2/CDK subfamily [Neonectria magnoliae]|uniref:Serine/threonine protein kinase, CMGC, CDC2/CDK subfamily n=1 Tax=Neonectria magnoliae TaxID=2732573 RepID=A0ABR1IC35_9HYPO
MKQQPKPTSPRRRRHAAMRDDERPDDQGERARSERGVKPSPRPGSPREGRHGSDSRARHRQSTRPEPSSHRRHPSHDRSRDRDRDRDRHPESDPTRRAADTDDLIPRYRAGRPFVDNLSSQEVPTGSKPKGQDKGLQPRVYFEETRSSFVP